MIWAIFAAMLLAALAVSLAPLLRTGREGFAEDSRGPALAVYDDQLREIQAEIDRGKLDPGLGDEMRTEIKRRMLALTEQGVERAGESISPDGNGRRRTVRVVGAISVALAVGIAVMLYASLGRPDLPSPASLEVESEAEAEAAASSGTPNIEEVLKQLGERLRAEPDNAEGWALHARSLWQLGRPGEAANSFGRAARLDPGNADLLASQGEALIDAMRGQVSPSARFVMTKAGLIDPSHPAPPYYLGLAMFQDGNVRGALEIWRGLEARSTPDSPWLPTLHMQISRVQEMIGEGPEIASEDVAAVGAMSGDEQAEFINAMVTRLEARLQSSPDDLDGWLRLARSYSVLGRDDDAGRALERALALAPDSERARIKADFSDLETNR